MLDNVNACAENQTAVLGRSPDTDRADSNEILGTQQPAAKKHLKITDINYRRNIESDYTEKIETLDKAFDYERDRNHWWSQPELSLLYGTPLYQEATLAQRQALNHLYWATQYNQTAATEANAVLYNQVTAGVFSAMGGYDVLCQELDLETDQERHHIHAFHSIGYKTKKALLGKSGFNASIQGKTLRGQSGQGVFKKAGKPKAKSSANLSSFSWQGISLPEVQDSTLRFVTKRVFLKHQAQFYSGYLQTLEQKGEAIPAQTTGLLGQIAPRSLLQFFTLNCGSSPFLACLFYATRFMANMLLKNYEYRYVQHYRELERRGEYIPTPTAVSFNHLMDEAFHTTTSQLIAQDLYKDFAKPSAYEKLVANLTIYRAQQVGLSGLSGGLPAIFRSDADFLLSLYRLLQSPVFEMSDADTRHWLERCLCQEHDGFHLNLGYHQRLLTDLRRHFEPMDYLWPVNREARVMAAGSSIAKAIENNTKAFSQFSQSLA